MNKASVLRALQFLRVIDAQNNLSLTNLAMMAVLARTLLTPQLSIHDLAVFLASVIGYQVKRFALPTTAPEDTAALKAIVDDLSTKVSGLVISGQIRR